MPEDISYLTILDTPLLIKIIILSDNYYKVIMLISKCIHCDHKIHIGTYHPIQSATFKQMEATQIKINKNIRTYNLERNDSRLVLY